MDRSASRPKYKNPPVVETILGVQFDRLPSFQNAHLGLVYSKLDPNEWPSARDAPLLRQQFEEFPDAAKWSELRLHLTQDLSSRTQITNKEGDRMIQVQNGRLHFNWLGQSGGPYPNYERVRDEFSITLERFIEFVKSQDLGDFTPNQWEVTYVNHIPRGTVWNTPEDWDFFEPLAGCPSIPDLIRGESFGGTWHFVIPDERGRLHIDWKHGKFSEGEAQELVVLTLTARGRIEKQTDQSLDPVFKGLDIGRDIIVNTFRQFMSDTANEYWGLENGSH